MPLKTTHRLRPDTPKTHTQRVELLPDGGDRAALAEDFATLGAGLRSACKGVRLNIGSTGIQGRGCDLVRHFGGPS
jgi:hypothetical protein